MSDSGKKNFGDLLGALLDKGVSTVEKNVYEKAAPIPKVEPEVNKEVNETEVVAQPVVKQVQPVVEAVEPVVETAQPVEKVEEQVEAVEPVIETVEPVVESVEEKPVSSNVSAISAEELAAAMSEKPAEKPAAPVSSNPHVSAISAEELAAAMGKPVGTVEYKAPAENIAQVDTNENNTYETEQKVQTNAGPTVSGISAEELAAAMAEISPKIEIDTSYKREKPAEQKQATVEEKEPTIVVEEDDEDQVDEVDWDNFFDNLIEQDKGKKREENTEEQAEEAVVSETAAEEIMEAVVEDETMSENVEDTAEFVENNEQDAEIVEEDENVSEFVENNEQDAEIVENNETMSENVEDAVEEIEDETVEETTDETVDETVEETTEENADVAQISEAELAAAKAAFNNLQVSDYEVPVHNDNEDELIDLEIEDETTPVKKAMTEEELEKQRRDEEQLAQLDEETRKEYEYLARKYSRNPIQNNNIIDTTTGDYDEAFDFEKRTDIKKVSFNKKKKPWIFAVVAAALVIAIVLPLYFLVFSKKPVEPVVLQSLELNQNIVFQYEGDQIDLSNIYMIASYSDGSTKRIPCTIDNLVSKPTYISDSFVISNEYSWTAGTLAFGHENRQTSLTVAICNVELDGIDARVYNTSKIVIGQAFSYENFDLFKKCTAANTTTSDGIDHLPSSFNKLFTQDEYADISVTITKNGASYKACTFADIKSNGIVFDEAGTYNFIFTYGGKTDTLQIEVE